MSEISTARPPRVRPFFRRLLSAGLVLLALYVVWNAWDYVEARRLDAAISDVRARGLYVDPPAHPSAFPEYADDVARFYMAAGDLIPANRVSQGMYYALRADKPMPPERIAEARAILAESEPALALVSRAQAAPVRSWRLPYGQSLLSIGKVSRLLSFRTSFMARIGQLDEAAASLLDTLDVSRASAGLEESTYYGANGASGFISIIGWGRAIEVEVILNEGRPSPPLLKRLEHTFAIDPPDDENPDGWQLQTALRDLKSPHPMNAYLMTWRGWPPQDLLSTFEPVVRPYLRHRLAQRIRDLTEIGDVSRKPWPDRLRRLEALAYNEPPIVLAGRIGTLPGTFTGALESTRRIAGTVVMVRSARVALAVEEFRNNAGRPPSSLSELVPTYLDAVPLDPFNGEPLQYHVDANAYTIYSVSDNEKDDGGNLGDWRPGGHPMHAPDSGLRVRLRPAGSD